MAGNYLEQLIAQWYEFQGFFVRQNVLVGKRLKGGYECELDIVAYHPSNQKLVHIEPSMDADSWANRERRFKKKFEAGEKYIPTLFEGFTLPDEIEQLAVLVFASKVTHQEIGGGRIVLIQEILSDIFHALRDQKIASNAIPEHLPIIRSFQLVSDYRKAINEVWSLKGK